MGPAADRQTRSDYSICQKRGNEKIRYVHTMEHSDLEENSEVVCVCVEKMSDDYERPNRREAKLRDPAQSGGEMRP